MINQSKLMEMAGDWTPSRSSKKTTAAGGSDSLAFVQYLAAPSFDNPVMKKGLSLAPETGNRAGQKAETKPTPVDENRDSSKPGPSTSQQPADDAKAAGGRENRDAKEGLSDTRDSGPDRQAESSAGVDGRENGVQPGASTEATVNAPPQSPSTDQTSKSSKLGETADENVPEELLTLMKQLKTTPGQEKPEDLKISAKALETSRTDFGPNLNLVNQQQIMFETGLAEHFVRMITDQFQPAADTKTKTESADAVRAAVAVNSTSPLGQEKSMFTASPAPTPTASAAGETETMNKIVQIVRSNVGLRNSQMTVRLDPPELGKMRLDVKLTGNLLQLNVTTQTEEARQIMLNRVETLRSNLEQNGIQLTRFEVTAKASEFSGGQDGSRAGYDSSGSNSGGSFSHSQNFNFSGQNSNPSAAFSLESETADTSKPINNVMTAAAADQAVNLVA